MKRTVLPALWVCLMLVTVQGFSQYCTSTCTSTSCAMAHEYIGNVTIDTLNNSSACTSAPSYEDFTALAGPTLSQASATPISVTVANWYSSFDTVTVFCDWNGNNILNDAGEVFPLTQGIGTPGGNTIYSATITPPVGAVATTRMRVKTVYGSSSNPCGVDTWSNSEDYTVNTLPPSGLQGAGAVNPNPSVQGSPVLFTVTVSAASPPSPPVGVSVVMNLSAIGGSAAQALFDDGTGGDQIAGDLIFSWATLPFVNGNFFLPFTATDNVPRTVNGTISMSVSPFNDTCASPINLNLGPNGPFSNANATDGAVTASCGFSAGFKDTWFIFTPPCTGPYKIDTCTPAQFDTILTVYAVCGGAELACDDDSGCGFTSEIPNIPLTAFVPILIRVAAYSSTAVGSFAVNVNQVFSVTWSSPFPNTIRFDLSGGPISGTYFHAITLAPGGFPNGWFYGVDILFPDLVSQLNFGWPFVGPLDACGGAFAGAFGPLPSGIPFFSVAVASNGPTLLLPNAVSAPASWVIP